MTMYRELSKEEQKEFRQWARENYTIGDTINPIWHPIVKDECQKMKLIAAAPDMLVQLQAVVEEYESNIDDNNIEAIIENCKTTIKKAT